MNQQFFSWVSGAAAVAVLIFGFGGAERASAAAEAAAPLQIAFVGDSMADGLWGALFRRLGKDKCLAERVKLIRKAKNGTGLTRLDQYNWIDEVAALADDPGVDLFVGSFGINDRQPIVERDKTRTDFGGPAFDARYKSVVADLLRHALAKGGSMLVVGLPVMLDDDANSDAIAKNKLFAAGVAEVASPRAAFAPPWTSQAAPDEYKPFLPNAKNAMVQVRASDGVHFTTAGYDMVMDTIYPSILASLKLRGRDLESECPRQVGAR
jgi:hypothetical protein